MVIILPMVLTLPLINEEVIIFVLTMLGIVAEFDNCNVPPVIVEQSNVFAVIAVPSILLAYHLKILMNCYSHLKK